MLHLCFDLDGVIADSTIPITACINRALADLDLPGRPPADLLQYIGPPLIRSFESIVSEVGASPAFAIRCVERYRHHYAVESLLSTRLYSGLGEVLERAGSSADLVVVTSKPAEAAVPILEALGVRSHFSAVHAPHHDSLAEPRAVTLARAMAETGAEPANTVMIGDRHLDIDAGRGCSVRTVGVLWGFGTRAELEAAAADHLVADPPALMALIEALAAVPDWPI